MLKPCWKERLTRERWHNVALLTAANDRLTLGTFVSYRYERETEMSLSSASALFTGDCETRRLSTTVVIAVASTRHLQRAEIGVELQWPSVLDGRAHITMARNISYGSRTRLPLRV